MVLGRALRRPINASSTVGRIELQIHTREENPSPINKCSRIRELIRVPLFVSPETTKSNYVLMIVCVEVFLQMAPILNILSSKLAHSILIAVSWVKIATTPLSGPGLPLHGCVLRAERLAQGKRKINAYSAQQLRSQLVPPLHYCPFRAVFARSRSDWLLGCTSGWQWGRRELYHPAIHALNIHRPHLHNAAPPLVE